MNRLSQLKNTTPLILLALVLACFALSPHARAGICPEGCDGNTENTFLGQGALVHNTDGANNTAIGTRALGSNTSGNENTATGFNALLSNTNGFRNTANGWEALMFNTTGIANTAIGYVALRSNTMGNSNTADGSQALNNNTTGTQNTATGVSALQSNTIANNNTADGFQALNINTGESNTAVGSKALSRNTTGSSNIGLGVTAGAQLIMGSNNIAIGHFGVAVESNTIRIGQVQTRTFIKGISGVALAGAPVVVNAGGQLGVAPSSADFKHEIRPMGEESEVILAFKPVSFCYNQDIDEQGLPQFGLVAEDVADINADLVTRDSEGKPYTVRYDAVNAMLLNEFLKEHRKVEQLETQIEALTAGLQKVSAQLEASKPAPQVVNNP